MAWLPPLNMFIIFHDVVERKAQKNAALYRTVLAFCHQLRPAPEEQQKSVGASIWSCRCAVTGSLSQVDWTSSSECDYSSSGFESASTCSLSFHYIQLLVSLTGCFSIFTLKCQYKHTQILLRLEPKMSATSWKAKWSVLLTFFNHFCTFGQFNSAMTLVTILWPWHQTG